MKTVATCFAFLLLAGSSFAQTKEFSGELKDSKATATFDYKMEKDKTYVVELNSSNLDAFLAVLAPDETKVAEDDDAGGGLNALVVVRPKVSGTYKLVASSYMGKSKGKYKLQARAADFGGEVDKSERKQSHEVELEKDKRYTVDLLSHTFDPVLMLMDKDGKVLAKNDDAQGTFSRNARLEYTPATSGKYQLLVLPFRPTEMGTYAILLRSEAKK